MSFKLIRQLIFNYESNISIILNDVLKIFEEENIISNFSIDIVNHYNGEVISLSNKNMKFIIARADEETMCISGDFIVDDKKLFLIGCYDFQGLGKVNNFININLYDKTGNYSIGSEYDKINSERRLCFKYFDNGTINDLYKLFEGTHNFFDVEDILKFGDAGAYVKPTINETFSWSEGKDKIVEFINSTLHDKMSMERFSKLVDVEQERHDYK